MKKAWKHCGPGEFHFWLHEAENTVNITFLPAPHAAVQSMCMTIDQAKQMRDALAELLEDDALCSCCEGPCEQPYTCPHCDAVRPCGDGSHCQACFKPNDPDAADDERRQS